jgi:catechol 2,3-dioxygenase-like lactoylglutathione lyase family enzyme
MLSRSPVSATLPVRDLSATKKFYTKLGLRLVAGSVRDGFLEFRAGGGTHLQCFQSTSKKRTDNTAATFEVKNLATVMRGLRRRGIEFAEYDLPGVKTVDGVARMGDDGEHVMAWIVDPDGHVLGLHQAG